jgi:hypothetical protein
MFAALHARHEHGVLIMLKRREVLESGVVRQCTNVHALHPMGVLTQCLPVIHPLGMLVQEHGVCHCVPTRSACSDGWVELYHTSAY